MQGGRQVGEAASGRKKRETENWKRKKSSVSLPRPGWNQHTHPVHLRSYTAPPASTPASSYRCVSSISISTSSPSFAPSRFPSSCSSPRLFGLGQLPIPAPVPIVFLYEGNDGSDGSILTAIAIVTAAEAVVEGRGERLMKGLEGLEVVLVLSVGAVVTLVIRGGGSAGARAGGRGAGGTDDAGDGRAGVGAIAGTDTGAGATTAPGSTAAATTGTGAR